MEPDGRDESLKKLIFNKERGAGIVDNQVRLYSGNVAKGFKELYQEKKDGMPYLFQFGVFKFPHGVAFGDMLFCQPVATNKNDQYLLGLTQ